MTQWMIYSVASVLVAVAVGQLQLNMDESVVVSTCVGKVRGARLKGSLGDEYYSFKGIPYAKPPVGNLRFKDPEPVESWTGIRDATVHGPSCAQQNIITNQVIGSDDCLYLNIYAKSKGIGLKRPVMVWIHGGGSWGNGDESRYGPDYFMSKDIVLVTLNYRLGALGFLNLNVEVAAGNQGLKDQVMALKWVRDNIKNFGGDPDNVTVFGESSGSLCAHYLAISPLTKGLFHKVIVQSGVVINPWAYNQDPTERAYRLCEQLGHTERDPQSCVRFLRTVDIPKLIEAQEKLVSRVNKLQFTWDFLASIDSKSKEPFMPVHPEVLAANGIQVPLIIGHTNREFLYFLKYIGKDHDRFNAEFDNLLHPNSANVLKLYGLTAANFKRIYLKNDSITKENIEKLIDLLGDLYYVEGVHRTIKTQVEKSSAPTYYYQYTYDKEPSFMKMLYNSLMSGACHGDDLEKLFHAHSLDGILLFPEKGSDSYKITEQMVELWVNFATTGNPTPKPSELIPLYWQPVDSGTVLRYLNICEDLCMDVALNLEQRYTVHQSPNQKLWKKDQSFRH